MHGSIPRAGRRDADGGLPGERPGGDDSVKFLEQVHQAVRRALVDPEPTVVGRGARLNMDAVAVPIAVHRDHFLSGGQWPPLRRISASQLLYLRCELGVLGT